MSTSTVRDRPSTQHLITWPMFDQATVEIRRQIAARDLPFDLSITIANGGLPLHTVLENHFTDNGQFPILKEHNAVIAPSPRTCFQLFTASVAMVANCAEKYSKDHIGPVQICIVDDLLDRGYTMAAFTSSLKGSLPQDRRWAFEITGIALIDRHQYLDKFNRVETGLDHVIHANDVLGIGPKMESLHTPECPWFVFPWG